MTPDTIDLESLTLDLRMRLSATEAARLRAVLRGLPVEQWPAVVAQFCAALSPPARRPWEMVEVAA